MENVSWYSCCAVTLLVCLWRGEGGKSDPTEEKIVQGQVLPCLPHLISSTQCTSRVTEMRLQWVNSWNFSEKSFYSNLAGAALALSFCGVCVFIS